LEGLEDTIQFIYFNQIIDDLFDIKFVWKKSPQIIVGYYKLLLSISEYYFINNGSVIW
jgi:hypothetical protein